MSQHLYREYLLVAAEAAGALALESESPFPYIVTTTSAPPTSLQTARYVVLELYPGADENLLFKRRLQPQLLNEQIKFPTECNARRVCRQCGPRLI